MSDRAPDLAALPSEILALKPPLAVAFAVAYAIQDGARIVYPPEHKRIKRHGYADIELILRKGQDRTRLRAAGFKTPGYPMLRRSYWRRGE